MIGTVGSIPTVDSATVRSGMDKCELSELNNSSSQYNNNIEK